MADDTVSGADALSISEVIFKELKSHYRLDELHTR